MTKGEINLLYFEIDKLLNDICQFLNKEIQSGYISPTGRSIANTLIERSKTQLQAISVSKILEASDNASESYVDMQGYKANPDAEYPEPHEVYSDVIEQVSNHSCPDDEHVSCPHANLPAIDIKEGKTGYLYRKDKIWFLEQHKKIYAGIFQSWLLVYVNENSVKPHQTFDLSYYEAKPASTAKDNKKREESFDLISTTDSKSYHFTALTSKDMMQWIVAINGLPETTTAKRSLPPVPESNADDNNLFGSTESCNNYEPLKDYQIKETEDPKKSKVRRNKRPASVKPLPLPPRNVKPKQVEKIIPRASSDSSVGSNYDAVGFGVTSSSQNNTDTFSEDDSDTHYDNPTELLQRTTNVNSKINAKNNVHNQALVQQSEEEEDDIYDCLQIPVDKPNPEITNMSYTTSLPQEHDLKSTVKSEAPKPKPLVKPKILSSFRSRKKDNI